MLVIYWQEEEETLFTFLASSSQYVSLEKAEGLPWNNRTKQFGKNTFYLKMGIPWYAWTLICPKFSKVSVIHQLSAELLIFDLEAHFQI